MERQANFAEDLDKVEEYANIAENRDLDKVEEYANIAENRDLDKVEEYANIAENRDLDKVEKHVYFAEIPVLDKVEKSQCDSEDLKIQNLRDGYPRHRVVVHENVEDYPFAGEIPLSFKEKPIKPIVQLESHFMHGKTVTLPCWSGYNFQDLRYSFEDYVASTSQAMSNFELADSPEEPKKKSKCGCFGWTTKLSCMTGKKKRPKPDRYYPEYD